MIEIVDGGIVARVRGRYYPASLNHTRCFSVQLRVLKEEGKWRLSGFDAVSGPKIELS